MTKPSIRSHFAQLTAGAFAVAALTLAPGANATQALNDAIPSQPDGCNTCHTSGPGSARNDFGLDVEANDDDVAAMWAAIYDLDSDGDGQTNGQELGDPCGDWTSGDAPRTTDISHPGDDQDTSADPDTPSCNAGEPDAGPEGGEPDAGPEEETGGCSASHVPTSAAPVASLGLLALFGLMRRRRD